MPSGSQASPPADRGHRSLRSGARRHADRRIVEPQNQEVLLHAAGWEPIARPRARADRDFEAAVGVADDLLAGEALSLRRIGHESPFGVVQGDGTKAGLRRGPAQKYVAAGVEWLAGLVGACIECDPIPRTDRQFAG